MKLGDDLFQAYAPEPASASNAPPVRARPRRQVTHWLVRGGPYGTMWYGGRARSILGHPRWRLWAKDAERFTRLERAVERWGGAVVEHP